MDFDTTFKLGRGILIHTHTYSGKKLVNLYGTFEILFLD